MLIMIGRGEAVCYRQVAVCYTAASLNRLRCMFVSVSPNTDVCCVCPFYAPVEWLQEEDLLALVKEFCSCWSTLEGDLSSLQKISATGKCEDAEISVKVRGGECVNKVNRYYVFER